MGEVRVMDSKSNLVDLKSVLWLLERFLRNATEEERLYFGLEVNRIFLNFQSDPKPEGKVKLV